jgi:hypothetical protein
MYVVNIVCKIKTSTLFNAIQCHRVCDRGMTVAMRGEPWG